MSFDLNGAMRIDKHYPVNKIAQSVVVESHIDDKFDALSDCERYSSGVFWKTPLPTRKSSLDGFRNLRSVVVGYLGNKRYQLKCVCGNYYAKKAKKIKSKNPINGICPECQRRYDMIRHNDYLKYGYNKHDLNWYVLNR